MPAAARLICLIILIGIGSLIIYGAIQHGPGEVPESFVPFWGKFVWTDITATFVLFALVVFAFERKLLPAVAMFVAVNLAGSAAIAAWLLWRGPELYRRLSTGR